MITKEEVLDALDIIERYKRQEEYEIKKIEAEADKRSILLLGISGRSLNPLLAAKITTIGQLLFLNRGELRNFRNIGPKAIDEINQKLKDFGTETQEFLHKHF